jgi:hypothetical protein
MQILHRTEKLVSNTPLSKTFNQQLRVAQLIKKSHLHCCGTEGPLLRSEVPITGPCLQPAGSSLYSHPVFFTSILSSILRLSTQTSLLSLRFLTKCCIHFPSLPCMIDSSAIHSPIKSADRFLGYLTTLSPMQRLCAIECDENTGINSDMSC